MPNSSHIVPIHYDEPPFSYHTKFVSCRSQRSAADYQAHCQKLASTSGIGEGRTDDGDGTGMRRVLAAVYTFLYMVIISLYQAPI